MHKIAHFPKRFSKGLMKIELSADYKDKWSFSRLRKQKEHCNVKDVACFSSFNVYQILRKYFMCINTFEPPIAQVSFVIAPWYISG